MKYFKLFVSHQNGAMLEGMWLGGRPHAYQNINKMYKILHIIYYQMILKRMTKHIC